MVRVFHLVTIIIQVLAIIVALAPFSLTFVEFSNNEIVDGTNVNRIYIYTHTHYHNNLFHAHSLTLFFFFSIRS